ncbi:MAG: hypothetical protein AAGU11_17285 [Syntrophobacteraceae bacterium]
MIRYDVRNIEFRGDPLEGLNPEQRDGSTAGPVQAGAESRAAEVLKDSIEEGREEQIERWMKNIKEFIRGIDVQAL